MSSSSVSGLGQSTPDALGQLLNAVLVPRNIRAVTVPQASGIKITLNAPQKINQAPAITLVKKALSKLPLEHSLRIELQSRCFGIPDWQTSFDYGITPPTAVSQPQSAPAPPSEIQPFKPATAKSAAEIRPFVSRPVRGVTPTPIPVTVESFFSSRTPTSNLENPAAQPTPEAIIPISSPAAEPIDPPMQSELEPDANLPEKVDHLDAPPIANSEPEPWPGDTVLEPPHLVNSLESPNLETVSEPPGQSEFKTPSLGQVRDMLATQIDSVLTQQFADWGISDDSSTEIASSTPAVDDSHLKLETLSFEPDDLSSELGDSSLEPNDLPSELGNSSFQPNDLPLELGNSSFEPNDLSSELSDSSFELDGLPSELGNLSFEPNDLSSELSDSSLEPDDLPLELDDLPSEPKTLSLEPEVLTPEPYSECQAPELPGPTPAFDLLTSDLWTTDLSQHSAPYSPSVIAPPPVTNTPTPEIEAVSEPEAELEPEPWVNPPDDSLPPPQTSPSPPLPEQSSESPVVSPLPRYTIPKVEQVPRDQEAKVAGLAGVVMGVGFCATGLGSVIGLPMLIGGIHMMGEQQVFRGPCPHCGQPLKVALGKLWRFSCPTCQGLVQIKNGRFYAQVTPITPDSPPSLP